jgi:hypothetical protein
MSHELGPLQSEFVNRLESGHYKQTKGHLCERYRDSENGWRFCALGVACELARDHSVVGGLVAKPSKAIDDGRTRWAYSNGEDHVTTVPQSVVDLIGLHGTSGHLNLDFGARALKEEVGHKRSIASLNDCGWSFSRIASAIRRFPQVFFKKKA